MPFAALNHSHKKAFRDRPRFITILKSNFMQWIGPLFKNAGGWEAFVAYESGLWYIDKDEVIEIGKGRSGIMLLPLLQKGYGGDYSAQIEILQRGLEQNGQNPKLAYDFPFVVPVITAYKFMPSWAESAVNWLPVVKLDFDSALEIYDACHDHGVSQKVRQKTLNFINQWSKSRGFQFSKPAR